MGDRWGKAQRKSMAERAPADRRVHPLHPADQVGSVSRPEWWRERFGEGTGGQVPVDGGSDQVL